MDVAATSQNFRKCVPLLAADVPFDELTPHLVAKGIISERRREEYLKSIQSNEEKFSVLILELCEQEQDIQSRFLQSLTRAGHRSTALALESFFGFKFTDSSPTTAKQELVFPDGCVSSKQSAASADEAEEQNFLHNGADGVVVKQGTYFFSHTDYNIYPMGSRPKGYALIIVNKDFDNEFYETRIGAERDTENMISLWEGLGYDVTAHFNKTASDMRFIFRKFAQLSNHKSVDSCVVVISSHGVTGRIVGTDNEFLFMEDILDEFNNVNSPHLMGKPKLFFVQACRGKKIDGGVDVPNGADGGKGSTNSYKLLQPVQRSSKWTEMVIAFSTVPEYVSMRNPRIGSWFIHAVTKAFAEKAHDTPLSGLFHAVVVLMDSLQSRDLEKQTPEILHRGWKRDLYFNPGLYNP